MPRTRSLGWTELKVGILAVVAVAIATTVIFLVSGEGGFFWQRYTLKTKFDNVAGLKPGAPVRVSGVEVGTVKGVAFNGTDVEVTFQLSREMQPRITTKSIAVIGSISLLGEASLDLTAAHDGTPVPEYGYVPSRRTPGQLADVAEGATKGLEQATQLIKDIRAGKGTVGQTVHRRGPLSRRPGFRRRGGGRGPESAGGARHRGSVAAERRASTATWTPRCGTCRR